MSNEFEEQDCISCFVKFCVPKGFTDARRKDAKSFYCPNGHSMSYGKSEADRLKEQLHKAEQARLAAEKDAAREKGWRREAYEEKAHVERRLAAQRGVTTRLRNRVANGVCPCCNRTFINLQRHMATKHAGFTVEEVQAEVGQTVQ